MIGAAAPDSDAVHRILAHRAGLTGLERAERLSAHALRVRFIIKA